ncbi:hypothetical protein ACFPMF_13565 [Larkinella bovis]|uniref:Uncharacterized protein n=1 Tax=Larkinella bovis TaxID=683041 RepID=A0ABW0ICF0_9BACT
MNSQRLRLPFVPTGASVPTIGKSVKTRAHNVSPRPGQPGVRAGISRL